MCTATYIRDKENRIIFTTNRDENAARPTSPPEIHHINGRKLLFPQDQLAGGTWVAVGDNGQISCVLNGAKDEVSWLGTTAEKSRGQVLLDSFDYNSPLEFFEDDSMIKAHPFTLLIIRPKSEIIYGIKWNGKKRWIKEFEMSKPQIWSAFTLYPAEQRKERNAIFNQWVKNDSHLNATEVWKIHQSSKANNGLLLENSLKVNTVSTTQLILDDEKCEMAYFEVGNKWKTDVNLCLK